MKPMRCLVASFACLAACARASSIDAELLARLDKAGQAAYDRFLSISKRLEERCEIRTDRGNGKGRMIFLPHLRREWIVRLGDAKIIEMARIPDQGSFSCKLECDNPDYHFDLGRSREDGPYALLGYSAGPRKLPLVAQGAGIAVQPLEDLGSLLDAVKGKNGSRLLELASDRTRGLVRAAFSRGTGNESDETELWADPDKGWRVVTKRGSNRHNSGTTRYHYGTVFEGVEFPVSMEEEVEYKGENAPVGMAIRAKVIRIGTTKRTEDGFRLSAFGFPEPPEFPARPKPWGWHLWLAGAAAVCALLSLGFVYLRRRWAGEARP
ncbi:MAG: hypothetical protein K2W96_18345 [Gemmataceae bacterium]|nr:hypothetical protein [Gemmataceae bacterium]